jgi:hypothetical protein
MTTSTPSIELEDDSSTSSNKRSKVYQYFTYKTLKWCCNYCSKKFGDKATTTLWRHLKADHPMICKEMDQENPKVAGEMDKYTTSKQEKVSLLFNSYLIILIFY